MFKAAKAGPRKAITANRLDDGRVVFLGETGDWPAAIDSAHLFNDGPELDAATAYAKAQNDARIIVEPYAIDMTDVGGRMLPARIRERIRALGPTVDYGEAEYTALTGRTTVAAAAE